MGGLVTFCQLYFLLVHPVLYNLDTPQFYDGSHHVNFTEDF